MNSTMTICYMSMIVKLVLCIWILIHLFTMQEQKNIEPDVEARFDTSNYNEDDERTLAIGKNKKVLGMMKDQLGGKIMVEFVALRSKMYACRQFSGEVEKRCKGTMKCYETSRIQCRTQHRFASEKHVVYKQRINKVALNINDDKRIQDNDENKIYAYGTSVGIICKEELVKITRNPERVVNWCLNQDYECGLRQLAASKIIIAVNM